MFWFPIILAVKLSVAAIKTLFVAKATAAATAAAAGAKAAGVAVGVKAAGGTAALGAIKVKGGIIWIKTATGWVHAPPHIAGGLPTGV